MDRGKHIFFTTFFTALIPISLIYLFLTEQCHHDILNLPFTFLKVFCQHVFITEKPYPPYTNNANSFPLLTISGRMPSSMLCE